MKSFYKDEEVTVWRRSKYLLPDDCDPVQTILSGSIDPVDVDYITNTAYQEDTSIIEIYNSETDKLVYKRDILSE